MRLDLGSIAKGYSLDVVKDILIENGVRHALLDFGGDLHVIGYRPNGQKWRIGIRSPIIGDNDIVGIVEVSDLSIFTSGGYERFFERDGVIYHHILNPKTGYPAESGLLSVTVISRNSTEADALSTASFVLGLEKGRELLERLDGFEGIFITQDKTIYTTRGLQGEVIVTNPAFVLANDL
jgi:thiamine biosynthesis lipoprotein